MKDDLIFDIGLHHGDDTAYYLYKGYRVVAIEANPVLARACEKRFESEIKAGRLEILNVGIGPAHGEFTFWIHRTHDYWSSFIRNPKWDDSDCSPVSIRCIPFSDLLVRYGSPYYLKVDIEGADPLVLDALQSNDLPKYVSFEAGKFTVVSLCQLANLGYDAFKCVDQTTHNSPDLGYSNEIVLQRWRRRAQAYRWSAMRKLGLHKIELRMPWSSGKGPKASVASGYDGQWIFPANSSGPFGEQAPGDWQTVEQVVYNWLHRVFEYRNRGTLKEEPWYDIHARLGSQTTFKAIARDFISPAS